MRVFALIILAIIPSLISANDLGVSWGSVYSDSNTKSSLVPDLSGGTNYNNIQETSGNRAAYQKISGFNPQTACVKEILYAQERYSIPMNLLLAIGIQESGRKYEGVMTSWPWTVNSSGTGKYFNSEKEAVAWLKSRMDEGYRSNDVGCMQINLKWHPKAFKTIEEGFDPRINVDYSARLLVSLYEELGSWNEAAGSYHSRTEEHKNNYLQSLKKNVLFANKTRQYFDEISNYAFENVNREEIREYSKVNDGLPIWSSWLEVNFNDNEGVFSLYSNKELEPILPNY